MNFFEIMGVYQGSDAERTKALYNALNVRGPIGIVATNLLRCCKNSERAKKYRGGNSNGSYRKQAYDRKQWSIENLDRELRQHAETLGINWGWGRDENQVRHDAVLYVELPRGQVSFHTEARGMGPDFAGVWDGVRGQGATRICYFAEMVLALPAPAIDTSFDITAAAARLPGAENEANT